MIRREQVADLCAGDLAEAVHNLWPEDSLIRGRIYDRGGRLYLCGFYLRDEEKRDVAWEMWRKFEVIERAPRPLYVNHLRTEPVAGDVVASDEECDRRVWFLNSLGWQSLGGTTARWGELPARLRLLVDGETGQVVQ